MPQTVTGWPRASIPRLAGQEWQVVTFDYRGMGDSAPRTLRGFDADVLTWARQDCAAALAFTRGLAPGRPLVWIGHSLGGQIFAITPGNEGVTAAVTIASGVGYWRENAYPLRRYSWWLWHLIVPVATAICGYFPGRMLRIVGDLPEGVIRQWSRWCRHPEYAVGVEGPEMRDLYRRPTLPMLSVSLTDDEYMSERNVAVLHGFYVNAGLEMRRYAPEQLGIARIGHFGFFRVGAGARLWPGLLDWITGVVPD
ncbi:MAG: alpha/beta fold hydrolase [Pseudomonadota bacterium]|nr:alpha/beta fold hydrolase [Pseudomonadota bacterium]